MKRGSLIALGLSAVTAALVYSRRVSTGTSGGGSGSADGGGGGANKSAAPGGGAPQPTNIGFGVRRGTVFTNAPPQSFVGRARDLIAKAKHDVASITNDEANEMLGLAPVLRASGYAYEADSLETLVRIRANYFSPAPSPPLNPPTS